MRYIFLTIVLFSTFFLIDAQNLQAQKSSASYTIYLPSIQKPSDASTVDIPENIQFVLDEINRIRTQSTASAAGCPILTISPELQQAATKHSRNMAEANFFQHRDPNGNEVYERVLAEGYNPKVVGENIAAGYDTAEEVVAAWMASPSHRANILDCSYTETGIGFFYQDNDQNDVLRSNGQVSGPYFSYWTQVFASR